MAMRCGLLGRKLAHSYSPKIHAFFGDYPYELLEKEPEDLENFLKTGDFTGLNVTIPYKKAVIPYCARLSPQAQQLGAVNTLVRLPGGSWMGHNTDAAGFAALLHSAGLDVTGKKCLVLGSGGASNVVVSVLQDAGGRPVVISRTGENNYGNLDRHGDAALLVNATPVGMYPKNGAAPVTLSAFPQLEGVIDLIYNPARTQLMLDAESREIPAWSGLTMLVEQARESAEWFTGHPVPEKPARDASVSIRQSTENIVLMGMPGCGKSTVARCLGRQNPNREVIDVDRRIAEIAGMPIPEIFARRGEKGFRELETAVLAEIGKGSGCIIATGGGWITRQENYPLLHQNGIIFWIRREIDKLPTAGRPLSKAGSLREMYRVREPLYRQFADCVIDNSGTVEEAAGEILTKFNQWAEGKMP